MDTYEKKYKEALEKARKLYEQGTITESLCYVFPELKESEDERIRKEIINHLQYLAKYCNESMPNVNKWIAWLEKQGEQNLVNSTKTCKDEHKPIDYNSIDPYFGKPVDKVKPIFNVGDKIQYSKGWTIMTIENIENGEYVFANNMGHTTIESGNKWYLVEQKLADKIEPKFKVGDWMVYEENTYQIHNISLKKYYECLRIDGTVHTFDFEYIDSKSHLWTIQDAKDGDVLVHYGCTFIFMGVKNGIVQALEKYLLEGTNPVCFGEPDKDNDYYPATKEQRDALMKAMADIGYTFDFEKKELKKIEQKPVSNQFTPEQANVLDKHIDKFLEQKKPTWSEEDERTYKSVLYAFEHHYPLNNEQQKFVKSLKERWEAE